MRKVCFSLLSLVFLFSVFASSSYAAAPATDKTPLEQLVEELSGIRYQYGGNTTNGFDCSGLMVHLFAKYDIELPRVSRDQAKIGNSVKKDELRPGDLVFFNTTGSGISHVGVYIGNGEFFHASTTNGTITNKLTDRYYASRYVTARRILDDQAFTLLTTVKAEESVQVEEVVETKEKVLITTEQGVKLDLNWWQM